MRGYTSSSYGDAFADVYDEWYRDVSDVDSTVTALFELSHAGAGGGRVLELGVGTGRLAIPLATAGAVVTGVDASAAMLARLAENDPDRRVRVVEGDMVDDLPGEQYDAVFVAYNTLFNLLTAQRQAECFAQVASRLSATGVFVVEAFVPSPQPGSQVTVRSMDADRVVLSISVHDVDSQLAEGQYVELTERTGVRLRPWSIRYAAPPELDGMAVAAGLALHARWGDFDRRPFTDDSDRHVSIYTRANSSQTV